jgi:hypothetical protein
VRAGIFSRLLTGNLRMDLMRGIIGVEKLAFSQEDRQKKKNLD